jgi:DNA-directed RNA polymerase subunit RPC12/RpoP
MRCPRCGGLMVLEKFEVFGLGSCGDEFSGWRCINCGAIVDPVIAAHRYLTPQEAASNPALTTV